MISTCRQLLLIVALILHHYQCCARSERVKLRENTLFFKDEELAAKESTRTVQAGEDVVLECEAAGRPSPTIYWQHQGVRLKATSDTGREGQGILRRNTRDVEVHPVEIGSTKARLYIDCARQDDAGLYTCVAETPTKRITTTTYLHVESDETTPSSTAHCINKRPVIGNRQMAARINMWTTLMLDFEGSNAVLFCRAEGNPRPSVTWLDNHDREIPSTPSNHDNQYLITENGDLVIRDVTWAKHMGLYKCYAHNSHGSDHIDTFLYPTVE